ncbi:MAG: Unknown protein [uncultured Thiotrichaceae bacterium]|uniref:Uncharacterized protein n=1 Tax=uncultured Thiotrichaceae bacterium TaxID=298394 RepID=A0A6S6SWY7_9GAMM|nr:MAG: Unknown protein [uncultured Thiotrichaceae bacterium]
MSEYQYYDFRAIDQSLTPSQMDELSRLSSRAQITSRRAEFVYNYGDFRGNPEKLVEDMFDIMLYVANWGARRLILRLPASLFDVSQCRDFFISEEIDHSRKGGQIILDLNFNEEDGGGEWIHGEEWLEDLLPLRDELLRGDFRILYLAWFKAAEKALCNDEIEPETPEPLVPPGLQALSAAQQRFAALLEIDRIDIQALAENSPPLSEQAAFKPEEWLALLPEHEKTDYLLRLSRGEDKLELHLNRRLKMFWQQANADSEHEQVTTVTPLPERRSIQQLLDACQACRYAVEKEAARKTDIATQHKNRIAAQKRDIYLQQLSERKNAVWAEVGRLIGQGLAKSYDQAVSHLYDLHELAVKEDDLEQFTPEFQALVDKYQRRRTFIDRLRAKQLLNMDNTLV